MFAMGERLVVNRSFIGFQSVAGDPQALQVVLNAVLQKFEAVRFQIDHGHFLRAAFDGSVVRVLVYPGSCSH